MNVRAPASFEELELHLELAARAELERGLDALAAMPEAEDLSCAARGTRLLWGASAMGGLERWRPRAEKAAARLMEIFFDHEFAAFRSTPRSRVLPAEGNALAALALARAAAAGHAGAAQASAQAVDFLRMRLYDPLLGFLSAEGASAPEYGLLGDIAWGALAAEELGRSPGGEACVSFAEELARVLVRDLWDPARSGFAARIARRGEGGGERPDPGAEAAALEACLRLGRRRAYGLGLAAARASAGDDPRALAAVARAAALETSFSGAR